MRKIIVNSERRGRKIILVDDEDYDILKSINWNIKLCGNTYYCEYTIYKGHPDGRNKTIKMHRYIMGVDDPKIKVDHKNRNGLDNRRANLRICNNSQNTSNSKKKFSLNQTSKFKGVNWMESRNRWLSRCTKDGITYFCGRHKDEKSAAIAYDKKALELHGEFANLNFPRL